jgi:hypothetical protein
MADLLGALRVGLRSALRRETLPPPPPVGPPASPRPGVLRQLFARESLGIDPEVAGSVRPGILATIFAHEPLGTDPPAPPRRRTPWLALLTRPERLDD